MFEKIKTWYLQGLWTIEMVQQAEVKGILTHEQMSEILSLR